jgi:hypothetical protein
MIHCRDTHKKNSFIGAINSTNAYSEAGCGVNDCVKRRRPERLLEHARNFDNLEMPAWPEGKEDGE